MITSAEMRTIGLAIRDLPATVARKGGIGDAIWTALYRESENRSSLMEQREFLNIVLDEEPPETDA